MILGIARGFVGELLVRAGRALLGDAEGPEIAPSSALDPDAPEPGFRTELSERGAGMRAATETPRRRPAPEPRRPLDGSREARAAAARARAPR